MARVKKIQLEKLGEFTASEKSQTSLRMNPNVLKLIKKQAHKEKKTIEKMIEKMAIFYINEV